MNAILGKYPKTNDTKLLTGKKEFETGKMYFFQHPAIGNEKEIAYHYFMFDGYPENWAVHYIPYAGFEKNDFVSRAIHFIHNSNWLIEFVMEQLMNKEWFSKCLICEVSKDEEMEIKTKHGYNG